MATRQREKAEKFAKERDKRPTAIAKYIRIPSDKIGIVLDLIRGRDIEMAAAILRNTNKSASPVVLKLLNSAAANAENNLNMSKDNLFVAECWAMAGPTLKRMMPRARGRADRILKRTSHIRIILDERIGAKTGQKRGKNDGFGTEIGTKTGKKEGVKSVKTTQNTPKTAPKPVVKTAAEKPLADKPNAKKPLGEKKSPAAKPAKGGKK
jgi:large subunit ribosomal protein L22